MRASALVAVLALGLAACATGSDGDFFTPPDDGLVLRVETGGGFVPFEYHLSALPEFSLYGDGRIITLGAQIEIYPQPALPPLVVRTVSVDAIGQIVQAARDAGLTGEDRDYRIDTIADAATTTFTLETDDDTHTTSVYALGFEDGPAGPGGPSADELADRKRLAEFRNKLFDLPSWIPAEDLGDEQMLTSDAVRVWVGDPIYNEELEQEPMDWPLSGSLAEHAPDDDAPYACATFTGADAASVLKAAAKANQLTPWVSDGTEYGVIFRPLLPDEQGCPG